MVHMFKKTKKDNVVMITKCKRNESKFVTILAETIMKPLISGFTKVEIETDNSSEIDNKEVYTCISNIQIQGK